MNPNSIVSAHLVMRKVNPVFNLAVAMISIFVMPSLLFYFGVGASFALGTAIAAIVIIIAGVLSARRLKPVTLYGKLSIGVCITLLTIFIFAHLCIAVSIDEVEVFKALASIAPATLMLFGASYIASFLTIVPNVTMHRATKATFYVLCAIAAGGVAGLYVPGVNVSVKPVFPFSEPSHFALSFLPLLMYQSVHGSGLSKIVTLITGFFFAFLLENLTLMVGCVLVVCISLRLKAILFFFVAIMLVLVGLNMDISYFSDRVNFSGDVSNLSTLVYLQGWQFISASLQNSHGWGLGFQQLGFTPMQVPAADRIFSILGGYLNSFDGGFVLSKFISEFGIFGIFVTTIYICIATRSFFCLRKIAFHRHDCHAAIVFAHCFLLSFLVEFFIRGLGYFTPTILLMLASAFFLYRGSAKQQLIS